MMVGLADVPAGKILTIKDGNETVRQTALVGEQVILGLVSDAPASRYRCCAESDRRSKY